jgi:D-psicose/D-tagatose/L-ribulose 3-epimerase
MKVGVSAFAWTTKLKKSHLDLLSRLRDRGLEGFEIPLPDHSEIALVDLRRVFERSNLECTVCAILPAEVNPISPDASTRKRALAYLVDCIEKSAQTGAHLIGGPLFAPIGYLPGRRRNENEWDWAVECFQSLGESLDKHEMTLSIEPVNRSETFFLNTVADAKGFSDAVGHPRIGVTIDTFHANIEEKDIAESVASLKGTLKHVHASENDRGLIGSGHIDFRGIIAALQKIEYAGFLIIEGFGYSPDETDSLGALWGDQRVSPEDIAFQGARYLRKVLSSTLQNRVPHKDEVRKS